MTAPYRILVTGSRDWDDEETLRQALTGIAAGHRSPVIVHGACPSGADAMADAWARDHGFWREPHPASWHEHGRAAGFRRNAEMVALGANVCAAFIKNGSRGATHTADIAGKAGIPVRRYERREAETR